jgi:alkanesulfonate monooxygenase SsuD/methylene tetrahydromethanopterin reductase-like flavin-dependent oxidoreductase (luciferase family)
VEKSHRPPVKTRGFAAATDQLGVGVVVAVVRHHLVAQRLAVADRFAQLAFATQGRLDWKDLTARPAK